VACHLLENAEGWVHLCLPAFAETDEYFDLGDGRVHLRRAGEVLHPERESRQTLDQTKLTINSYDFAAQYQQSPMPLEGGLIKWSWFRFYDRVPERQEGDLVTQSWDTAAKVGEINDFSVCTTWLRRGNDHYLIDVTRGRHDFPTLKRLVKTLAKQHRPGAVLIEDNSSGTQLIQDLQQEGEVRPIAIKPQGNKEMRMYTQSPKIEAGHVLLPREAPWLENFKVEMMIWLRHKSSSCPSNRFDREQAGLGVGPVLGDIAPHVFPYHLGGRPVLCPADFEELVPEVALNADAQSCIFVRHERSVTNGCTNV
jgi:predicted phage terminase large subunit-like protein